MAQSILDKINTLISANLHGMVDNALQANSVQVMDEYVRQAERNLDQLEEGIITLGGSVKTLKRKADEYAAEAERMDHSVDLFLSQNKTELARAAQAELNTKKQAAQDYYTQWQQQQTEYQNMLDARTRLQSKLQTTRQEREHLKALMELAETKKLATKTIRSLNDVSGVGDDDVRRLGDAIRARLDREDADLDYQSQKMQSTIQGAVADSAVDAQLEERKRRLGMGNSGDSGSTGSDAASRLSGSSGN